MNQLRADFRAADGAEGHDQSQFKIDIAEGAMPFRRHHRFANDVGEVGADREIPIQSDGAQGRPGNKTAADAEESTENPDHKSDNREIDRADVRAGNWKKHIYSERPRRSRNKSVVTFSRTTACPMMSRIATPP